ncbi:13107_t:CDS:2, partial [Acaulospora morrowiae]
ASSDDIEAPSDRVRVEAFEASRKGVDAMEAVGESRKNDGSDDTTRIGKELISNCHVKDNKDGKKNNNIVQIKGDPRVDLQNDRDEVVIVPTGDITITSCDDLGGCSKKENGELVINGTSIMMKDGSRFMSRMPTPEGKTEYETEGEMLFISKWEPWDPEDSRNDD